MTKTNLAGIIHREDSILVLPGAPDAITARVIEEVGFEAVYVSGAGISNTKLGLPDLGFVNLSELQQQVGAIRDVVGLPLVVDADTGFGGPVQAKRTVRLLERAGANAIQIEDQEDPKRCGHFANKRVISAAAMTAKIAAACEGRSSEDTLIIGRTDAADTDGLDAACDRANMYREAGADIVFVEAVRTREDMRRVAANVGGTLVLNVVEGGKTPIVPALELREMGYSIALYANTAMRAALRGMERALLHLHHHGDTAEILDSIFSWKERQDLVRKDQFDSEDERFLGIEAAK